MSRPPLSPEDLNALAPVFRLRDRRDQALAIFDADVAAKRAALVRDYAAEEERLLASCAAAGLVVAPGQGPGPVPAAAPRRYGNSHASQVYRHIQEHGPCTVRDVAKALRHVRNPRIAVSALFKAGHLDRVPFIAPEPRGEGNPNRYRYFVSTLAAPDPVPVLATPAEAP